MLGHHQGVVFKRCPVGPRMSDRLDASLAHEYSAKEHPCPSNKISIRDVDDEAIHRQDVCRKTRWTTPPQDRDQCGSECPQLLMHDYIRSPNISSVTAVHNSLHMARDRLRVFHCSPSCDFPQHTLKHSLRRGREGLLAGGCSTHQCIA
jgi:hypothetical protein